MLGMNIDVEKLFEALGGIQSVADKTGCDYHAVAAWKYRNIIPAKIQLAYPNMIKKGLRIIAKENSPSASG